MTYRILHADNAEHLERQVTAALAEGWHLQGGVSVSESWEPNGNPESRGGGAAYSQIFAQAMCRAV